MPGHGGTLLRALRLAVACIAVASYATPHGCCFGAQLKKDWDGAKAEKEFLANFELPEAVETAVRILDDDTSMHRVAASDSDLEDDTQQTVIDELFGGTWGAFIVKDNSGQSAERPPSTDSAETSNAATDELVPDDSNVADRDFDYQALGDTRFVPDESADDFTPATGDWSAGDVAAADHSSSAEATDDDALLPHERVTFATKADHAGKDTIRSHWRRGHDQAASRRRTTEDEPAVDDTATELPTSIPEEASRLSSRVGHHVVTFRFPGLPGADVTAASPGRGHGANVKNRSDAGVALKAAATDETPAVATVAASQRPLPPPLTNDGLGHWGRFLPPEAAPQQQLRRTHADGDGSNVTVVVGPTERRGHADGIRRPTPTPEHPQPEHRSDGFALAFRRHSPATVAAQRQRTAVAVAAAVQERKPDFPALAESEVGRVHSDVPGVSHSVDRDGWRRFAPGGSRPSSTAAAMAVGDGLTNGVRLPSSDDRRTAAPAAASADALPTSWLQLARRQRQPQMHRHRDSGLELGNAVERGDSVGGWGAVDDDLAADHEARGGSVGRLAPAAVISKPSRVDRRPRPRPTVEGRFVA